MGTIEIEKTFLAKYFPTDLFTSPSKEIIDIYIPDISGVALRLRKNGEEYSLTRKTKIDGDASKQLEETLPLSQISFEVLQEVKGKRVRKIRYNYSYENEQFEIDVFQDELAGLVLVDKEFTSLEEKERFTLPDFCLVDVTESEEIAGKNLAGKSLEELASFFNTYGYKKLG